MKNIKSFCITVAGILITAIAYQFFLNPHMISVGGITGLCVLLQAHTGLAYMLSLNVLNIGLYVWGLKVKGLAYVFRSYAAMSILGILLDCPFVPPTEMIPSSPLVAMMLGSLLSGIGYGIIVSQNTSTGGSDLLGMIVTAKIPRLTTGMVMTLLDLFVVVLGGFLDGMQNFAFSLVAMTLCNGMIDLTVSWISDAGMPSWLQWIYQYVAKYGKRIRNAKVTVNPYALVAAFCVLLILVLKYPPALSIVTA